MALAPGETSESFIREVDENLRRDQAEAVVKRYGSWFAAAAVLLLLAVGGWLFWQNRQNEKAATNSETFSAILSDVGQPKQDSARRLDALAADANPSMEAAARLTRAALALQSGDRTTAVAQYGQVADDKSVPQAYRDAALVRRTQLEFDSLKPEDVVARLQPLAVKDNAWYGAAGELTALAMLKSNRRNEAATLLKAIAAEKSVPATIRARVEQLAGSLSIPAAPAAR
ncbi:tetratricopeptide repeat protein [Sphingomonas sp. LHG3406-1]|uniref:tetratricopeptide repeat protein n=1 Tax=Sphingomonas sp. LHG3406-1 TaxID=2804617 RepID=UPI00261A4CB2|nr:tetratricopeptide repeat protein [Sphingomonas sp. LHG3406-1]